MIQHLFPAFPWFNIWMVRKMRAPLSMVESPTARKAGTSTHKIALLTHLPVGHLHMVCTDEVMDALFCARGRNCHVVHTRDPAAAAKFALNEQTLAQNFNVMCSVAELRQISTSTLLPGLCAAAAALSSSKLLTR
jgi:hypothetical protein